MDPEITPTEAPAKRRSPGALSMVWHAMVYTFDNLIDSTLRNLEIMWREFDLFFGALLFFSGLFGFSADKFCDGNTADYLSCTRPTAYYFYDKFHLFLILVGAVFVLLWMLKRFRR